MAKRARTRLKRTKAERAILFHLYDEPDDPREITVADATKLAIVLAQFVQERGTDLTDWASGVIYAVEG